VLGLVTSFTQAQASSNNEVRLRRVGRKVLAAAFFGRSLLATACWQQPFQQQ
jgi:hypothetical protein